VALHGDGGPTASRFLMQLCADLCGVELRVATMPDCSPLGAVFAGQLGLGVVSSLDALAVQPREDAVYSPRLETPAVDRLTEGWRRALRQVIHS
jgi:glycerol kinase